MDCQATSERVQELPALTARAWSALEALTTGEAWTPGLPVELRQIR